MDHNNTAVYQFIREYQFTVTFKKAVPLLYLISLRVFLTIFVLRDICGFSSFLLFEFLKDWLHSKSLPLSVYANVNISSHIVNSVWNAVLIEIFLHTSLDLSSNDFLPNA